MTKSEEAAALFRSGANCAQAVLGAFHQECGLDRESAFRLASGFGAGMGLPNMKKYTDSMKIDTEVGVGTTITMTVNL
mgnify:CR=1 FL=1